MTRKNPVICDLKSRRQALGWSHQEVGDRCGIDEAFLNDWEHGIGAPRLDALEQWAAALGLKLTMAAAESDAGRGLKVDWQAHRVTVDGAPVRLTPMEWKALERLARNPGQLVSHEELFRHLYGEDRDYRAQSTAIRVLITKLRRLLPVRIEAQWGRGYVVSDIDTVSPPQAGDDQDEPCEPAKVSAPVRSAPVAVERPQREHISFLPRPAPRPLAAPIRRELVDMAEPPVRRLVAPTARVALCRNEELGVIERFLAERGVTRCPDVATIEHSPLPTLVWDKLKRKWVRPALSEREAS